VAAEVGGGRAEYSYITGTRTVHEAHPDPEHALFLQGSRNLEAILANHGNEIVSSYYYRIDHVLWIMTSQNAFIGGVGGGALLLSSESWEAPDPLAPTFRCYRLAHREF